MGFRIKIAPGVRVSVHHRHIRTHIGPRIARVHVGQAEQVFQLAVDPNAVRRDRNLQAEPPIFFFP
jgi:hypothetical protein